jgi:stage II sporulation protein AA (anti-sigma F factor antagonist)
MKGELDHHLAKDAKEKIEKQISKNHVKNIIFDLGGLSFMDSSGIGIIIGRYKYFEKIGGKTIISNLNPRIERIITISGLRKIITIYKTTKEALKHV